MNKKELLEDLKSMTWCDGLNGEPQKTPDSPKADGGNWYTQNVREINPDGKSAIYRNIYFYVFNEGTKDEVAYYMNEIPKEITKKAFVFSEKIKNYAEKNGMITIEKIEEYGKFAILKKYEETPEGVIEKRVLAKESKDGTINIKSLK